MFNKNNSLVLLGKMIPREKQGKHRVGVIPYVVINNKLMVCLGIDTNSGDLTDFGGGLKKADRTVLKGAFREFKEESGDYFKDFTDFTRLSSRNLDERISLHNSFMNMSIIFLPVPRDYFSTISRDFFVSKEIKGIRWYNFQDILVQRQNKICLYSKVRDFLLRANLYKSYLINSLIVAYPYHCFMHSYTPNT